MVAAVWDPVAVAEMQRAGVGAQIEIALGGKTDMPAIGEQGRPFVVTGSVRTLTDGRWTVHGPMYTGVQVDMGPSALRLARLAPTLTELGHALRDLGNVEAPVAEAMSSNDPLPYADAIADTCRRTFERLRELDDDSVPIVLGGDHSISMGSVAGVAGRGRTAVLWIDAHADLNTPATSPSGNLHGMPLAHLFQNRHPAHVRQAEVEQHQIAIMLAQPGQRRAAVRFLRYLEAALGHLGGRAAPHTGAHSENPKKPK